MSRSVSHRIPRPPLPTPPRQSASTGSRNQTHHVGVPLSVYLYTDAASLIILADEAMMMLRRVENPARVGERPYNNLLRRLSDDDYAMLEGHLVQEIAGPGELLYSPGDDVDVVQPRNSLPHAVPAANGVTRCPHESAVIAVVIPAAAAHWHPGGDHIALPRTRQGGHSQ